MSSSIQYSIRSKVEARFANAIAKIHKRFDKGITRYRKKLDKCKAFLKSNRTRKNPSSFTNRLSSFRSNVSECQAMIAKIAELEEERLDKLAEQEYLINRKVEEQLQKYYTGVKMDNFAESLLLPKL